MKRFRKLMRMIGLEQMPLVRKVAVAVIGTTVVLFGIALIVLPGPAVLVIPLGLAILASEFAWARRIIRRGSVFVAKARRGRFWRNSGRSSQTTSA
jgi:uncharacterized protein (TIGR02611 family)